MGIDLSIIIVNYNVKEFLENLIHSIEKATQQLNIEIIVIDNNSNDGSCEYIPAKFPNINFISNKHNAGFAKANNQGIDIAKGKYLLLLNPDTLVQEDTFVTLISLMDRNNSIGMATCKILNADGTLQLACRRSFPGPWVSFTKMFGLSALFPKCKMFAQYNLTYLDENKSYEVDAISGSFMFLRKEVIDKVVGLDCDFFMYGEDLDFCYRIKEAGYKIYYYPETSIIHYKGESTKRSSIDEVRHFYNAMQLFVKKHFSQNIFLSFLLKSAISFRELIAFLVKRKKIIISVVLDFLFFALSLLISEKYYKHLKPFWAGFPDYSYNLIYIIPTLFYVIISYLIGSYKKDKISIISNFTALITTFISITSFTFFFKSYGYSRAVILICFSVMFVFSTLWRAIYRIIFSKNSNENVSNRTVILGCGEQSVELANKLKQNISQVHNIVGLISITSKEFGKKIDKFSVIGNIENIIKIITEYSITKVIIPPNLLTYNDVLQLLGRCKNENVEFLLSANSLDYLIGKNNVSLIPDVELIKFKYNILNLNHKTIKRILDFLLAFFTIILTPILIVILPRKVTRKIYYNLIEILRGNISFVGTRVAKSNEYLGKKGITGYWYILDTASDPMEEDKMDLYYAKNQNVFMDFNIIIKSINKAYRKTSKQEKL